MIEKKNCKKVEMRLILFEKSFFQLGLVITYMGCPHAKSNL